MLEEIVYANPAGLAIYLNWVCEGYERAARKHASDGPAIHPLFGMMAASTCASPALIARLPSGNRSALRNAAHVMESWVLETPALVRDWNPIYWKAVLTGCEAGLLQLHQLRITATGTSPKPVTEGQIQDRTKAMTLGRMLGQEYSDQSRWRALARGLHPKGGENAEEDGDE